MQTASASAVLACPVVDVEAELAYWRGVHANGHLGTHAFSEYSMLLKMGYDIYLAYPRATEAQLYRVLQEGYYQHRPMLSVPWDEARWIVRHAWHHMETTSRRH